MHPEEKRTPEEITKDKILLLSLFSLSTRERPLESMLKAQKLSFLTAMPLFLRRQKAFSLEFYRHLKGPMSTGVYKAIDDFSSLGLMKRDNYRLSDPTQQARSLFQEFFSEVIEGIPENRFVGEQLVNTAKEYGNLWPSRLVDIVYDMKVPTVESKEERTVRDTPLSHHFTYALDATEAESTLTIPDDWMDTLSIALNPKNHSDFITAISTPGIHL
jgi:hypothetical protein